MSKKRKITNILSITIAAVLLTLSISLIYRSMQGVQESRRDSLFPKMDVQKNGKVLFLSSYKPTFPSLPHQLEGIESVLSEHGFSYDVEYMDAKTNYSREDQTVFLDMIGRRIKAQGPYRAVLLGDDEALQFALKYQHRLFKGLPMVFFAVNDPALAEQASENDYITGEIEQTYFPETIEAAKKILPGAKTVTAIVDNTNTGIGDLKDFLQYAKGRDDYSYDYLNASEMSRSMLGEELSKRDDTNIILYMSCSEDNAGNYYTVAESSAYIGSHAPVPVFRANGGGFGAGITGGMVMDFKMTAADAAQEVVDVLLDGKDIRTEKMPDDDDGVFVFDQKQLDRFEISSGMLPSNTMLLNARKTLINETNIDLLLPGILTSLSMLILLLMALFNLFHEKRLELQVQALYADAKYKSEHDQLLGIYNRDSTEGKLLEKYPGPISAYVVMLDIDDMKNFNDTHDHQSGNLLLQQIAGRLKDLCGKYDGFLSRYGGDQFLMVIEKEKVSETTVLLNELKNIFEQEYFITSGLPLRLTASMGLAICSRNDSLTTKVSDAEIAMFESKRHGKSTVTLFKDSMRKSLEEESSISAIIKEACEKDGFMAVYQPKVLLKDHSLAGFEALCRLKNYQISPAKFIPIAEQNGDARKIGRIMTSKVIRQLAEWRDAGLPLLPVSINYSPVQLSDKGYVHFLKEELDRFGIDPRYIELEITESEIMSNSELSRKLFSQLQEIGINILLDDFGSGYTSLAYLSYIPAEYVKLDKSLIDSYLQNNPQTIRDLIRIAQSLGKKVIAEGVEDREQCDLLSDLDCDYIQGYYFSKPLMPNDAITFRPAA